MNLNQYLESVVNNYPDKTAIKFKGKAYSYNTLLERVCRLSNAIKNLGLKKGDVVGIISTNSNTYIEIIYACARIGVITAHYNWRLNPKNIIDHIKGSETKLLFVSDTNEDIVSQLPKNGNEFPRCVIVGGIGSEYESLVEANTPACPIEDMKDTDVIQYMFTSGTTSKPKTVMHTNKSLVAHSLLGSIELGISSDDRLVHVLPMFHATISMVYCTMIVGGTVVIMDKFESAHYLQTLQNEKATIGALIPVLMDMLTRVPNYMDYDLSRLKSIVYAGAPMTMETFRNVRKVLNCGLYQVYGITEMGPSVTMLKPDHHLYFFSNSSKRNLPVGKAILGTAIKIISTEGKVCKSFENGEIVVKSDTMMKGYKESGHAIKAIENGWFYTGDIGYLDDENFLYLKDRKNHMIISGGENIYPAEIEACIRSIGKSIVDVAVIGVPDDKWGESVKAVVVRSNDSSHLIVEEDIIKYCHENIAPYKKPRSVEFWAELPRNQSGKLLKHIIKDMVVNKKML